MIAQFRGKLQRLHEILRETSPSAEQMATRLRAVEKDIILPVKGAFILILAFYLYYLPHLEEMRLPRSTALEVVERVFLGYVAANIAVSFVLFRAKRYPVLFVQRVIFSSSFLDALFLASLTFIVTGGFSSTLYWVFLGLIVRNAVSTPRAIPQLVLNCSVIFLYLFAGIMEPYVTQAEDPHDVSPEALVLRLFVLLRMSVCCYGLQVLFEKQRRAEEEAREFAARQEQLHSARRLASQIAHQIKNPLGIINSAAYSLQKALEQGKNGGLQQVSIIREEVERSDQILTKLMGYAQLAEGKVESLKVHEELDRAIGEVFPLRAGYTAIVEKDYSDSLPVLFMQRGHLSEILVNILQNAREATNGKGRIGVMAEQGADQTIVIRVTDDGPGIAKPQVRKIFEPYYSTKDKGTGLGLSIVKHNVEMYGGRVSVESELGKGATFVIQLPTRTFMKLQT